jgi:hypothetical protein
VTILAAISAIFVTQTISCDLLDADASCGGDGVRGECAHGVDDDNADASTDGVG